MFNLEELDGNLLDEGGCVAGGAPILTQSFNLITTSDPMANLLIVFSGLQSVPLQNNKSKTTVKEVSLNHSVSKRSLFFLPEEPNWHFHE